VPASACMMHLQQQQHAKCNSCCNRLQLLFYLLAKRTKMLEGVRGTANPLIPRFPPFPLPIPVSLQFPMTWLDHAKRGCCNLCEDFPN
jgi:hypothetical protein